MTHQTEIEACANSAVFVNFLYYVVDAGVFINSQLSHLLMSVLISVVVVFHFYSVAALLASGLGFGVKVRF